MLDSQVKKIKKGAHAVKRRAKAAAGAAAPKTPDTAKRRGKVRVPLAAMIAGGMLVVLLAALCAFTFLYPHVFPGVTVGTIPVSGMDRAAAAEKIEQESPALYAGQNVSVTIYETTYDIPVEDVLDSVDSEQSAENAHVDRAQGAGRVK